MHVKLFELINKINAKLSSQIQFYSDFEPLTFGQLTKKTLYFWATLKEFTVPSNNCKQISKVLQLVTLKFGCFFVYSKSVIYYSIFELLVLSINVLISHIVKLRVQTLSRSTPEDYKV